MNRLKCFIVDDERLARASLRALLEELPDVEVMGEADRPKSAIVALRACRPDVLLLDVQMPGGGGFEVLRQLADPPAVIFVTAHDEYAVRAFEVNAVDYLLKPVDPARLRQALERAARWQAVTATPPMPGALTIDDAVWLELGASGHFRLLRDIQVIEADGKYTKIYCAGDGEYSVRQTMAEWDGRLPPELFLRLDRSIIINHTQIQAMEFQTRKARVTMTGSERIVEVGRAAANKLRTMVS